MSEDISENIDQILSDVLADIEKDDPDIDHEVTFAQTVSEADRIDTLKAHIDEFAAKLDAPTEARTMAKSLSEQYRSSRGDLHGTAFDLVAASCLYCGAKVTETPLQPTDFTEIGGPIVSRNGLLRRSKDIASTVGLDPSAFFETAQYVDRYCEELDASEAVQRRAKEILEICDEEGLSSGKSPSGWAGAAVYNGSLDVGEKYSQKEVSAVADTSEVTIRNRYQEQRDLIRQVESVPDDPAGVIEYIADRIDADSKLPKLARILIANARDEGYPVDEEPRLWGLAALRRANELGAGSVTLTTLSQYTPQDSSEISKRSKDLRSVISQFRLHEFRTKEGEQDTS